MKSRPRPDAIGPGVFPVLPTFETECERIFNAASEAEIKAARMAVKTGLVEGVHWLPCEAGECRICWRCIRHDKNTIKTRCNTEQTLFNLTD